LYFFINIEVSHTPGFLKVEVICSHYFQMDSLVVSTLEATLRTI